MTPHPLATWVQMQVSPQREVARRRRRRIAVHLLHRRQAAPTPASETRVPRPRSRHA